MEATTALVMGGLLGLVAGLLYFGGHALGRQLGDHGRPGAALSVQALRRFFCIALLAALIHLGLAALLAGAAGVLLGRQLVGQWQAQRA